MIDILPYSSDQASEWDALNESARNGHLLFYRGFMGYHADRFTDASLVIRENGGLLALFPANRAGDTIISHQGLTFGGLVLADGANATKVLATAKALVEYLQRSGATRLVYKAVPHIYHRRPAEEDLYALARVGARLVRRDLTTTIDLRAPGRRGSRRERGIRAARKAGLRAGLSERWVEYWAVLTETLSERHGIAPTHTLLEIQLLARRFPDTIRLFVAEEEGTVVAGIVVFESATVAHAQYIAASPRGRQTGALDKVFGEVIERYALEKRFFDFGISTTDGGRVLNEGLIAQKEEFGGSATVHDVYEVDLG